MPAPPANREALPGYLAHAAVTCDGRAVTGIVVAQPHGSVTLRTSDTTDRVSDGGALIA